MTALSQRTNILQRLQLTGPASDPSLDRVARLAAVGLAAPIGLVTFLDNQQWHKGRFGWDVQSLPMQHSFCAATAAKHGVVEVPDTHADARLSKIPLAVEPGGFRFYAGRSVVYEDIVLGSVCVLDIEPRRITEEQRTILGDLACLVVDVLHARDRQLTLQLGEQRAMDFASASGDWFWETDAQNRLAWVSGNFESQTGVPARQVMGTSANDEPVVRLAGQPQAGLTLGQLLDAKRPFRAAVSEVDFNGTPRLLSRSGVPCLAPQGEFLGYRGITRDVTEQYRLEDEARERDLQRRTAEQASQAKSRFLSRVSHELRTPLNAVLGFAQLLLCGRPEPLPPSAREHVEAIHTAGDQLLSLIDDLLHLSRVENGEAPLQLENVDVGIAVQLALRLLQPLANERNVALLNEVRLNTVFARANERALGQVLLNLVSNAIKYNRPGGQVILRCLNCGLLEIEVRDSGTGMTAQQIAHLFEPFNRLGAERSDVHGTGLGLVIARSMVEAMGGQLQFESRPREGTTARVRLKPATLPTSVEVAGGDIR